MRRKEGEGGGREGEGREGRREREGEGRGGRGREEGEGRGRRGREEREGRGGRKRERGWKIEGGGGRREGEMGSVTHSSYHSLSNSRDRECLVGGLQEKTADQRGVICSVNPWWERVRRENEKMNSFDPTASLYVTSLGVWQPLLTYHLHMCYIHV